MTVPVIIGVGQVTNRSDDPAATREPIRLMEDALRAAADDAGGDPAILRRLDSVDVVNVVSWAYGDVAGELAARVGANPAWTAHSEWGGNQPTLLVDRAAEQIASGEHHLVAVVGAEAFRSLQQALKGGGMPPWPAPPPDAPPPPDARSVVPDAAWDHGLRMPVEGYPLYENALRADMGQSLAESQDWSARMWARMSVVAATNDGAWNPSPMDAEAIRTPSKKNRMVCFPYPKLMNALLSVDQGAAVILADVDTARRLGVEPSRWIHPWGGAGAHDTESILDRTSYSRAPAMELVLDDVFPAAGISPDDVDLAELYSCFPCVPKMALRHLGWDPDRPMSVTGGLTFFGGAGNNYMTHAIVAMTRAMRRGQGTTGLLYGQGGFVTKHHALVVSTEPRPGVYPAGGAAADAVRQATVDALPSPPLVTEPRGEARVETYTVVYDRAGEPERGIVVGLLPSGERFVANTPDGDREQLDRLVDVDAHGEPAGAPGSVESAGEGRNCFRLS